MLLFYWQEKEFKMFKKGLLAITVVLPLLAFAGCSGNQSVKVVSKPDTTMKNDFYVGNRAPLLPSPFIKLPIGAIRPEGWVRRQLELEAEGFVGHLAEISRFLKKDGNAWLSTDGVGQNSWEELPYWLKGFGDLGYVLGDKRIIDEARIWIDATIASQREDGYFGPRSNLTHLKGKSDIWPNMIMLNVLQSFYEYSGDERVLELMTKYFHWQLTIPDEDLLLPYWQQQRAGDNLASVYWLYNRTGDEKLLELAEKVHRNTADWTAGVPNWHGVNITQCFRGPAIFYQQSKDPKHLNATERDYDTVMGIYGQVPGGMFGADENCREGYIGPQQAAETCSMVEFMLSDEMLLKITGDAIWADRCEEVAFNSLPASMTPDLKALHYLTSANMVICDAKSKSPGVENGGPMFLFNPHDHRCCQHNVAHGWPYYAESLWMATPGNGLAAVLYAPCQVTAKVGDGTTVTIVEGTRYPFEGRIRLGVLAPQAVSFPLYLRVPGWCDNPKVTINGKEHSFQVESGLFIAVDRTWSNGDTVELELPMEITLTKWAKNQNSISVNRGPLTYSLKIGQQYVKAGGTEKWPAWEIRPTTPWNYGLLVNEDDLASSFEVVEGQWPSNNQPFKAEAAPITMVAKGKRIPAWQQDHLGLVGKLQPSPVKSLEPTEKVTLIPMGCAHLRISAFPQIGMDSDTVEWEMPPEPRPTTPTSASHCWTNDLLTAASDGLVPQNSNDQGIPRFTWWDHKGTIEWIQYDFKKPTTASGVEVYWFDDEPGGGCRIPQSWRLLYKDGEEFKPVANPSEYGTAKNKFNTVKFDSVTTTVLRIEVQLQPDFSAGILEWKLDKANAPK